MCRLWQGNTDNFRVDKQSEVITKLNTDELYHRIEDFGNLEDGWDSYSGKKTSEYAIERSKVVLLNILKIGVLPEDIFVAPVSTGGVSFEFRFRQNGEEMFWEIPPALPF